MNRVLTQNWNETVGKDDTIYIIGDFVWGNSIENLKAIVEKLNGVKHLILGNHDNMKVWSYIDAGITSVHTSLELGDNIVLAHDPCVRCMVPEDKILIHGHVHTLYRDLKNQKCINVSVENWDYRPISMDTILNIWKE